MKEKDKKFLIGSLVILFVIMIIIGFFTFYNKKESNNPKSDALLFQEEYESLNGVINEETGKTMKTIEIDNNNPVDILTEEETITLLENQTGILYLGFPNCPWCRNLVPVLLQTLNNMDINKLYYLNILEMRDEYIVNEDNKLTKSKEGSEAYYKMLTILDDYLEPYTVLNKKQKEVDTKEKRILAPTVVGIKDGKVVGVHVGTVTNQKDAYTDLTVEQQEELANELIELINKVYDINCDEAC